MGRILSAPPPPGFPSLSLKLMKETGKTERKKKKCVPQKLRRERVGKRAGERRVGEYQERRGFASKRAPLEATLPRSASLLTAQAQPPLATERNGTERWWRWNRTRARRFPSLPPFLPHHDATTLSSSTSSTLPALGFLYIITALFSHPRHYGHGHRPRS